MNRNFSVEGLVFTPEIAIELLNFDASQRAQNKGSITLKSNFFGGTVNASLSGTQLRKRGENLERGYDTELKAEVEDVAIGRAVPGHAAGAVRPGDSVAAERSKSFA